MFKKICFIIIVFLFTFIGLEVVSAKITCEYNGSNKDVKLIFDGDTRPVVIENGEKWGSEERIFFDTRTTCPDIIYVDICTFSSGTKCASDKAVYFDSPHGLTLTKASSRHVYCGREAAGRVTGIPKKLPELTSLAITIMQIAVPVILVVMGTLDLLKGVTAQKEDEIKKGQQLFVKRLIVGAIIFFVVVIVKFFISIVADTNQTNIVDCIDCFISNDCEEDFS